MQSDTELDILLDYQSAKVREMLQAAYEAGRVAGRREAAKQIQVQLSGWMGNIVQTSQPPQEPASHELETETLTESDKAPGPTTRAPRGAIRAALLEVLQHGSARLDEIVSRTGHNTNSVRSTLYLLRNEKVAKRDGDVWSLANADDQASGADDPAPDDAEAAVGEPETDPAPAPDEAATSQDVADPKPLF